MNAQTATATPKTAAKPQQVINLIVTPPTHAKAQQPPAPQPSQVIAPAPTIQTNILIAASPLHLEATLPVLTPACETPPTLPLNVNAPLAPSDFLTAHNHPILAVYATPSTPPPTAQPAVTPAAQAQSALDGRRLTIASAHKTAKHAANLAPITTAQRATPPTASWAAIQASPTSTASPPTAAKPPSNAKSLALTKAHPLPWRATPLPMNGRG